MIIKGIGAEIGMNRNDRDMRIFGFDTGVLHGQREGDSGALYSEAATPILYTEQNLLHS